MSYKVVRINQSKTYSAVLYSRKSFYECKGYLESIARRGSARGYKITWEKGRLAFLCDRNGKIFTFAIGRE